jgi:Plasmid encoded RepA protein
LYDSTVLRRGGLEPAGSILRSTHPNLVVSKQKLRRAEVIELVREKRETASQTLGFASRPFVLCGLQVTGHPSYGLPWGQDRLVLLYLATLAVRQQSDTIAFNSGAEMLDTFGMQQGGSQYRRLIEAFQRVFGATIFFGTDNKLKAAPVFHQVRFNFMSEARIWCGRNFDQPKLPGDCQNVIVLTPEFCREVTSHPIPTDLQAAKALSCAPAALDLFTWLSYRCFIAKGEERIPIFGEFGLVSQLGSGEYRRPRKFRECLENWLNLVKTLWPSCPARISADGMRLIVVPAAALARGGDHVCA